MEEHVVRLQSNMRALSQRLTAKDVLFRARNTGFNLRRPTL